MAQVQFRRWNRHRRAVRCIVPAEECDELRLYVCDGVRGRSRGRTQLRLARAVYLGRPGAAVVASLAWAIWPLQSHDGGGFDRWQPRADASDGRRRTPELSVGQWD